jgi:ABC-type Mn2+/Zn2+ transport system permease subunit
VRFIEYLTGPHAWENWSIVLTGVAIAIQCSLLSVFVVLRQMSFIGHGVSHAALAGIGLAAVLGFTGNLLLMLVGLSCLGAALSISAISARSARAHTEHDDTAIGIVLAASMALGAVLLSWRERHPLPQIQTDLDWEEVLFGSIDTSQPYGVWLAWVFAILIALMLFQKRRGLLLWLYDPAAARLSGVRTATIRLLLLLMISGVIVVSVRLTGVVLVTALLILPGALALRVTRSMAGVFLASTLIGVAGMLLGLAAAFETGSPPGASVVLVMSAAYAAIRLAGR